MFIVYSLKSVSSSSSTSFYVFFSWLRIPLKGPTQKSCDLGQHPCSSLSSWGKLPRLKDFKESICRGNRGAEVCFVTVMPKALTGQSSWPAPTDILRVEPKLWPHRPCGSYNCKINLSNNHGALWGGKGILLTSPGGYRHAQGHTARGEGHMEGWAQAWSSASSGV